MERFGVIKEKYALQRSFSGAIDSTSHGPVSWMEKVVVKVFGSSGSPRGHGECVSKCVSKCVSA